MSKMILATALAAATLSLSACGTNEENNMAVENFEDLNATDDMNMGMDMNTDMNMDMNTDMNATENVLENTTGNATGNESVETNSY